MLPCLLPSGGSLCVDPSPSCPHHLPAFFVFLPGTVAGPKTGPYSVFVNLLMGVVGFPVFSGGRAGIFTLTGPTGGFLWGFTLASFICGMTARKKTFPVLFSGMMPRLGAVYLVRCLWFAIVLETSFTASFFMGAMPFHPEDSGKALLATGVTRKMEGLPSKYVQ